MSIASSKFREKYRTRRWLRCICLLSLSPKSLSVFSVKIGVGTSMWSRQGKFVATFWALCHVALDKRWTSWTCEGSAVAYVEGEATLRTLNYSLSLRHDRSLRFNFQKRDSLMALLKYYGEHVLSYLGFVLDISCLTYSMNCFICSHLTDIIS